MASGTPDREGWFIEDGQGFPGILLGSRAFLVMRWTTPKMVLEDVLAQHRLYLTAKPSNVGVDVDGLSCPLHCPTVYGCQTTAQSSLSGTVLPYLVAKLILREPLPTRARMLRPSGWGLESLDRQCLV
jgi:hypothetical protein